MSEIEITNDVETDDVETEAFTDELSDEALDRRELAPSRLCLALPCLS